MRFLEERAEPLVLIDDSAVRVVKKDFYSVVKYKMFSGLTIRHIARSEGAFDPVVVHRVENLQTLCTSCHRRIPKTAQSTMNPQRKRTKL